VHALVQLDRDYAAAQPTEEWEDWYAARLRGLLEDWEGTGSGPEV